MSYPNTCSYKNYRRFVGITYHRHLLRWCFRGQQGGVGIVKDIELRQFHTVILAGSCSEYQHLLAFSG